MSLFRKIVDSGETYTAEDFLNEEGVNAVFSNESGATIKIAAVCEDNGFIRTKTLIIEYDEENGYGNYQETVSDFFGTLGERIFMITVRYQIPPHSGNEIQQ